jgi:hypothetical protein
LDQRSAVRRRYSLPALLVLALLSLSLAQATPSAKPDLPVPLKAEVGLPILKNYSARDYKGSPQGLDHSAKRRGVMFFGDSSSAMLEYDGVTWRKIFVPSSVVRSLVTDDAGKIWVGVSGNADNPPRCLLSFVGTVVPLGRQAHARLVTPTEIQIPGALGNSRPNLYSPGRSRSSGDCRR